MPRLRHENRQGVVATTIAGLLAATVATGATSAVRAAEDELSFNLVAVSQAPATDGVEPLLVITGHGSFMPGSDSVDGSGGYVYIDNATEVPKTILSSGTWEATEVVQWVPADDTYAGIRPGVLDLRVNLVPEDGPVIEGALLRVNCQVGPGGITNNDPETGELLAEGFWLTVPGAFGPTAEVGQFAPMDPVLGLTHIGL